MPVEPLPIEPIPFATLSVQERGRGQLPLRGVLCPLSDHLVAPHKGGSHRGDGEILKRHLQSAHGVPISVWRGVETTSAITGRGRDAAATTMFSPARCLTLFLRHSPANVKWFVRQLVNVYGYSRDQIREAVSPVEERMQVNRRLAETGDLDVRRLTVPLETVRVARAEEQTRAAIEAAARAGPRGRGPVAAAERAARFVTEARRHATRPTPPPTRPEPPTTRPTPTVDGEEQEADSATRGLTTGQRSRLRRLRGRSLQFDQLQRGDVVTAADGGFAVSLGAGQRTTKPSTFRNVAINRYTYLDGNAEPVPYTESVATTFRPPGPFRLRGIVSEDRPRWHQVRPGQVIQLSDDSYAVVISKRYDNEGPVLIISPASSTLEAFTDEYPQQYLDGNVIASRYFWFHGHLEKIVQQRYDETAFRLATIDPSNLRPGDLLRVSLVGRETVTQWAILRSIDAETISFATRPVSGKAEAVTRAANLYGAANDNGVRRRDLPMLRADADPEPLNVVRVHSVERDAELEAMWLENEQLPRQRVDTIPWPDDAPIPVEAEVVLREDLTSDDFESTVSPLVVRQRGIPLNVTRPSQTADFVIVSFAGEQLGFRRGHLRGVVSAPPRLAAVTDGQPATFEHPWQTLIGKWLTARIRGTGDMYLVPRAVRFEAGGFVIECYAGNTIASVLYHRATNVVTTVSSQAIEAWSVATIETPDPDVGDLVRFWNGINHEYGVVQTIIPHVGADWVLSLSGAEAQQLTWARPHIRRSVHPERVEVLRQRHRTGPPLASQARTETGVKVIDDQHVVEVSPLPDAEVLQPDSLVLIRSDLETGVQYADHGSPHVATQQQVDTRGRLAIVTQTGPNGEGGYVVQPLNAAAPVAAVYTNAMFEGKVTASAQPGDAIALLVSRQPQARVFGVVTQIGDEQVQLGRTTSDEDAFRRGLASVDAAVFDEPSEPVNVSGAAGLLIVQRQVATLTSAEAAPLQVVETPPDWPKPSLSRTDWTSTHGPVTNAEVGRKLQEALEASWRYLDSFMHGPGIPTTATLEGEHGLSLRPTYAESGAVVRGFPTSMISASDFDYSAVVWNRGRSVRSLVGGWAMGHYDGTAGVEISSAAYGWHTDVRNIPTGIVIRDWADAIRNAYAWYVQKFRTHNLNADLIFAGSHYAGSQTIGGHRHVGFAWSNRLLQLFTQARRANEFYQRLEEAWTHVLDVVPFLVTLDASGSNPSQYPTSSRRGRLSNRAVNAGPYSYVDGRSSNGVNQIMARHGRLCAEYGSNDGTYPATGRQAMHCNGEFGTFEIRAHDATIWQYAFTTLLVEAVCYASGLLRLRAPPTAQPAQPEPDPIGHIEQYGFVFEETPARPQSTAATNPRFEYTSLNNVHAWHEQARTGLTRGVAAMNPGKYLDWVFSFHKWTWDRLGGALNIPTFCKEILWLAEQGWDYSRVRKALNVAVSHGIDVSTSSGLAAYINYFKMLDALVAHPTEFLTPLREAFPESFGEGSNKIPTPPEGYWDGFLERHQRLEHLDRAPAATTATQTSAPPQVEAAPLVYPIQSPRDAEWVSHMLNATAPEITALPSEQRWATFTPPQPRPSTPAPGAWSPQFVREDTSQYRLLRRPDGVPIGCIAFNALHYGTIHSLLILPEYRDRDYARTLVQEALRELLERRQREDLPWNQISTTIDPENIHAMALFTGFGFDPTGAVDPTGETVYTRAPNGGIVWRLDGYSTITYLPRSIRDPAMAPLLLTEAIQAQQEGRRSRFVAGSASPPTAAAGGKARAPALT